MELSPMGGELIFGNVENAVRLLNEAEEMLAELKKNATGTLRIGASDTIFQYILSDRIVAYSLKYPQVVIELISDVTPNTIEALKSDRCDIGFLNLPIAPDNGIVITDSIKYLNDIFIAGKRFEELKDRDLTLRDLQKYPLILMEGHTVAREAFESYAKNHGVQLKPAVEVSNWGLMKQLVVSGMGIGCIPREYSLNKLGDGSIFELHVTPPMPLRSVGMALSKTPNMSFALKLFIDSFQK